MCHFIGTECEWWLPEHYHEINYENDFESLEMSNSVHWPCSSSREPSSLCEFTIELFKFLQPTISLSAALTTMSNIPYFLVIECKINSWWRNGSDIGLDYRSYTLVSVLYAAKKSQWMMNKRQISYVLVILVI